MTQIIFFIKASAAGAAETPQQLPFPREIHFSLSQHIRKVDPEQQEHDDCDCIYAVAEVQKFVEDTLETESDTSYSKYDAIREDFLDEAAFVADTLHLEAGNEQAWNDAFFLHAKRSIDYQQSQQ